MWNICAPVLMRAVGCAMAGKSVLALELDAEDYRMLREQFRGDDSREIAAKLLQVLDALAAALPEEEFYGAGQYFGGVAEDYAVRIGDAVGRGTMKYVL